MPFFSVSGSDFVEMFVGIGASRVRDLFKQGALVHESGSGPTLASASRIPTIQGGRGSDVMAAGKPSRDTDSRRALRTDSSDTNHCSQNA